MDIPIEAIKALRDKTSAGIMDCKNALMETGGDIEAATEALKKKGLAISAKKAHRTASQGLIEAYVHAGGRIGAMVEVNCETDFVARTPQFKELAHDLALQVAATNPVCLAEEDMPDGEELDKGEACLLLQPFIKEPQKVVQDIIAETVAKVGENIRVGRFARFELTEQGANEPDQV